MNDKFWDDRYSESNFAYGILPNTFFKDHISILKIGSLLLPAEGEGRNAVYASKLGWDVTAFDSSKEGKEKALKLAASQRTKINYIVTTAEDFQTEESFDAIALIYAHLPFETRVRLHARCVQLLKPGGHLIFEAFSEKQLAFNSGGPKDIKMLFSRKALKSEFEGLTFNLLKENNLILNEGKYHKGMASVIRMIATKN